MSEGLEKMIKKLQGDGPLEKQIILLKLTDALENAPDFGQKPIVEANSSQRMWLARVSALLSRLGLDKQVAFKASFATSFQYWPQSMNAIQGQVLDAIEEIKLELELDGRAEIGSAYDAGDVYQFFSDLKGIIAGAEGDLLIVDPYFNGEAFEAYLSELDPAVTVNVLADRYSKDIRAYVEKHEAQYGSNVLLKKSREIHDRLVVIDGTDAWIMGGSIKDAGKKPTYLIPIASPIAEAKITIYQKIWEESDDA